VRVPTPEALIAQKVLSASRRAAQPKGDTDRRDLKLQLSAYPALKSLESPVSNRLKLAGADADVLAAWAELVASNISPEETDGEWGG